MNDNIAASAEDASGQASPEEICQVKIALRPLLGDSCDIEIGKPKVEASGVYQCCRMGNRIAYRHFIPNPKSTSASREGWQYYDSYCPAADTPSGSDFSDSVWQEAKRRYVALSSIQSWRSDDKLQAYEDRQWTIDGLIEPNSIAWIYAPPDSYKTYLAIDMACSIATGTPWCGREVAKGPVLFVSAEGGDGIHARRRAWEIDRGKRADWLRILQASPDVTKGLVSKADYDGGYGGITETVVSKALDEFKSATGEHAALIVFDTYAQTAPDDTKTTVTAYEKELKKLVRKHAPGAAILVIDHATKEGGSWMGSLAKLGNMDMMAMLHKKGEAVTLTMRHGRGKIKNAEPFDDIKLTTKVVRISDRLSNLVLVHQSQSLTPAQEVMLEIIGDSAIYKDLRAEWQGHEFNTGKKPGTVRKSMADALQALVELDLVQPYDGKDDEGTVLRR